MNVSALLGSFLPTVLTIIIVVAGVAGTLFTINKPIKIAIVSLIILAGIGTFVQSYQSNRDIAFLKGALSTMLASTSETPGFDQAIFDAAFSIAKKHGYYISRSVRTGGGERLYFLTPENSTGETVGGVLPVKMALKGELYVNYISGDDLKSKLEQAIFGTDATSGDSSEKAEESYLQDLSLICSDVLSEELGRRHMGTASRGTVKFDPPQVTCYASDNEKLALTMDTGFITRIKPMNHAERYGQAYSKLTDDAAKWPK